MAGMELLIVIVLLAVLDVGALRFGADSRDRSLEPNIPFGRVGLS